jgi:malyl-CoA/(S)-citramalyl-CoA lyase
VRNPRDFAKPLAIGAPAPVREIPMAPSRMIHFFDPANEKMAAKLPDLAARCDVLLGNLEDAVPVDRKEAARAGLVRIGREIDLGECALWTRVNALESPWALDDITTLVGEIGDRLEVVMVPKVEGPWDIHYVDRLLAQLEARAGLRRPILVHAILETALGVANVEEIAAASPRMQGMSMGPADLASCPTPTPRTRMRPARAPSRTCGTTRSGAWSTPARRPGSCRTTGRSATSATSPAARRSSAPRS